MLQLFNSLTRKKELFTPLVPGKVGLYVCGITVYDLCHLGHARSMVCFDVIVRFLRALGNQVYFVRNITDIDDKIIQRAAEKGIAVPELTAHYIEAMHRDCDALNILRPDAEPRATTHINAIIALIERLFLSGQAYLAENGDVCYQVSAFADYGKLAQKDLEGQEAGARVALVQEKRSPMDFVLWKRAKPGEPAWTSPWGEGRPGWHIECSAMAMEALGETFDIHGGGLDLQFPHHENEIAQSEAATGKPFANYWLHTGMLQVNNEKMSKSLGNFHTIESVLAKHPAELLRFFLLSSHYRSPLNYSEVNLANAHKALGRMYQALKDYPAVDLAIDPSWKQRFFAALEDDFNTALAISVLFELCNALNKEKSPLLASTLRQLGAVLGLLQQDATDFLQSGLEGLSREEIEALIAARQQARQEKNWAEADRIRGALFAQGIEIEDSASGTSWRTV